MTECAIFSILLYFSFLVGDQGTWAHRAARLSLLAACTFPLLDEFHQSFSMYRGSSPLDLGLDRLGAAVGISMIFSGLRAYRLNRVAA